MIGIDTNVLVRIVYDDLSAPEQCEKARSLVSSTYLPLLVNNIVLVETVWILGRYDLSKSEILEILEGIASNSVFKFENPISVRRALSALKEGNADFSDYLLVETNQGKGCDTTYTFDKKAARNYGFTLLEEEVV